MEKTIVFTGGGTGGHVFPGLAIIDQLKNHWEGNIVWIGSSGGMERQLVRDAGVRFIGIPSGKLRRYISMENIIDVARIIAGFISAFFILARIKPAAVFSKGGYVTVPVVAAAALLHLYTVTHESDLDPGLATKINSFFVNRVLVSFEQTRKHFSLRKQEKIFVTGNPIRPKIFRANPLSAYELLGLKENLPIILFIGGSQGAIQINTLLEPIVDRLRRDCFIVHQTGNHGYHGMKKEHYITFPFIGEELFDLLSAADLVVSRAGANMLWEIGVMGKPSILIPLTGSATRGDQVKNARYFEENGAAVVLMGEELTSDALYDTITELITNKRRRETMGEAARTICGTDSNDRIIEILLQKDGKKI
mgnify:CR=1 FL=1